MHTTENLELFVTYLENYKKNTGEENPIVVDEEVSVTQSSMSLPLVFLHCKRQMLLSPIERFK